MQLSFLNRPFPGGQLSGRNTIVFLLIGGFVSFFLIVFQPFGIAEWQTDKKFLKLLGYGIVSFIMPLLTHLAIYAVLPKRMLDDNWTVLKEILETLLILVMVAVGNMLYGNLLGIMSISFFGFFSAFTLTLLLGIFPVAFHVIYKHNKFLRNNVSEAMAVNEQISDVRNQSQPEKSVGDISVAEGMPIVFTAENGRERFSIDANQLLFIESADNYSKIYFIAQNVVQKHLIRSSLKRIEQQCHSDHIVRCHRAYIVNLRQVKQIEGNAAGYRLAVHGTDFVVPVSRSYAAGVVKKLKSVN